MTSTFTWLDTSERDRRRALDVIDLFERQDTLDELGVGTVRDALADLLAPGTTTIQTRARYFLFVPWIYLALEERRVSSADVARRARQAEIDLIEPLAKSADASGTIGVVAGAALRRLPSAVYWAGLGTLGIRLCPGSQDQYHRSLDRFYDLREASRRDKQDPEHALDEHANWHPHLPKLPAKFPGGTSFALTRAEAEYLQDRILARVPGTLLAFLVDRGRSWEPTRFAWEHPQLGNLPERIARLVEHARCFSELMHGAALLYNLMLSESVPHEEWGAGYRDELADWSAQIEARARALRAWDRAAFWSGLQRDARIPLSTRLFAESWIERVLAAVEPLALADDAGARASIADRERFMKRARARLQSREYLELWSGATGAAALDYRWGTTQTIVLDILSGLGR
jgi:hypothetical protein